MHSYLIVFPLILLLWFIWYRSTYRLVTKTYQLKKTAEGLRKTGQLQKRLTIAQISDTHFSRFYSVKRFKRVRQTVTKNQPDLIVFTGDLIENYRYWKKRDLSPIKESLQQLQAPFGKFAILGNHDYRSGGRQTVINLLQSAGFTVLINQSIFIPELDLALLGLDDARCGHPDYQVVPPTASLTIALLHEPDQVKALRYYADLILVGHSHGGQIALPFFRYKNPGSRDFLAGFYRQLNHSLIFVNTGIGTTGPPARFRVPPEIVFFELDY